MAELVLGALGVVPLAILSYQNLSAKLRDYQNRDKEISRVLRTLEARRAVFEYECQLLLRHFLDDMEIAEAMVDDPNHDNWSALGVSREISSQLSKKSDACGNLIKLIKEAIEELDRELDRFISVKSKQERGERLKDTWKRVGNGLIMSVNKGKYESKLAELQANNSDLTQLRLQMTTIDELTSTTSGKRKITDECNLHLEVRTASTALHKALWEVWCCGNRSHVRHFIKLLVEADRQGDNVCMSIALSTNKQGACTEESSSIPLQVTSNGRISATGCVSTAKRVKLGLEQDGGHVPDDGERFEASRFFTDLRHSTNICADLSRPFTLGVPVHQNCRGFIEVSSPGMYRCQFFSHEPQTFLSVDEPSRVTHADALLSGSLRDHISTVDKLRLARSLVLAVLNLHQTPWLKEIWRLRDIHLVCFGSDVPKALKTLHLKIEVSGTSAKHLDTGESKNEASMVQYPSPPDSETPQIEEDERLTYGIYKFPLYCLGVALLKIDRALQVEPEDVLDVRKLAKRGTSISPGYHKITQKCLRGHFGEGSDLSHTDLQKAVRKEVLDKLDSMIEAFDSFDL